MSRRRSPKRSSKPQAKRPAAAEPVQPSPGATPAAAHHSPPSPGARQKRFLAVAVALELAWLAFLVVMAVVRR